MGLFKTDVLQKKRDALAVFDKAKAGLEEFLQEAQAEVSSKEDNVKSLKQEIAEEKANIEAPESEMDHSRNVISNIQKITS